jgi:serine/threonine-protein kinase
MRDPSMRSSVRRTLVAEALPRPFGPYVLLSRLSAGGMAELFLAVSRSSMGFEKLVVVKRIHASRSADPAFVAMFVHEARLAATLAHPNIVQAFDAGEVDGRFFIAMEHVHGEDAQAALAAAKAAGDAALPLDHAVTIAIAACGGLAYVHERCDASGIPLGVIHRDVCGRNIVVGFSGDVKVVDFGIAKSDIDDGEDTPVATLKGKVGYMSPEQIAGEPLDVRTDVFSLGVVLFELTTGVLPFRGRSDVETFTLVRDAPCPAPSSIVPGYPPALERIVMRALEKAPANRHASTRELQADLEAFARDAGLVGSQARLGAWMRAHFADRVEEHAALLQAMPALVEAMPRSRRPSLRDAGSDEDVTLSLRAPSAPPPTAASIRPSVPWKMGSTAIVAAGAVVLAGAVAAVIYVARGIQHEMALRTDLMRSYHEEQAFRPPPADTPEATGAIEVTSTPPAVAIWLNGALRPEVTPVTLDKLAIDRELHVKLVKEGYEVFRTTLRLTDESPFKEVNAEMKALPATVVLHLEPSSGVNVWVDGKLWKGDHGTIEGLTPGVEHWLLLASPGYVARMASVTPGPGETATVAVRLVKSTGKP